MKKIEPAHYQFRRNHNGHVSRWMTAPDPHLIKEFGYEVRQLWTDDALQAVAEAVRDATWRVSGEGWNGEYPGDAKPEVDIAAIINQLKGE